jgi:hypothetical protein
MLLDLLAEWQACGVSENHIDPNIEAVIFSLFRIRKILGLIRWPVVIPKYS